MVQPDKKVVPRAKKPIALLVILQVVPRVRSGSVI